MSRKAKKPWHWRIWCCKKPWQQVCSFNMFSVDPSRVIQASSKHWAGLSSGCKKSWSWEASNTFQKALGVSMDGLLCPSQGWTWFIRATTRSTKRIENSLLWKLAHVSSTYLLAFLVACPKLFLAMFSDSCTGWHRKLADFGNKAQSISSKKGRHTVHWAKIWAVLRWCFQSQTQVKAYCFYGESHVKSST